MTRPSAAQSRSSPVQVGSARVGRRSSMYHEARETQEADRVATRPAHAPPTGE